MRALAARHTRIADLALSFPTLLFALAVPRPGLDPARAIERAIAGAPLAEVAAAADLPFWLRRLPPEAPTRPLAMLPDSAAFRRRIANHLPSRKLAPAWLQSVSDMADLAHDDAAIWIAREMTRGERAPKLNRLRLIGLWAWFSTHPDTLGCSLMRNPWTPDVRLASAVNTADDWLTTVRLHVELGREPIAELWLRPAHVCGYDFQPLASGSEIAEEAEAMRNCLRTYGYHLAHNQCRLWSMRKNRERVATLKVAFAFGDPFPNVVELKGAGNSRVPLEVWWAARQWLNMHDLPQIDSKQRAWDSVPLDRRSWVSLWRPYWLAKRHFPRWLPMVPSRAALRALE